MMRKKILVVFALLFGLGGCAQFPFLDAPAVVSPSGAETQQAAPVSTDFPQPALTQPAEPGSTDFPQSALTQPAARISNLKIWLPPQMDPAGESKAARMLQARLQEFSRQHDGLVIEVRVKELDGPGGLLGSLAATSAAAPLALPDLIALPRPDLEAATLKGLLQPFEYSAEAQPGETLEQKGWYEYARELAQVQNSVFGLPFAGDALVLVYRPEKTPEPPADWPAVLELTTPFVFPAADNHSLFLLSMVQSNGGALRDADGRPFLDVDVFSQVLTFLADAEERGVMPYWLAQYDTDQETWDAFQEKRADLVVTWLSRFLAEPSEDASFALLPSAQGKDFTFASGWVWAMAARDQQRQALSIELAQYITEDAFLANWVQELGLFPVSAGALGSLPESEQKALFEQAALSARLLPATDILTSLGLPAQQAAVSILKNQAEPLAAAQEAAKGLTSP